MVGLVWLAETTFAGSFQINFTFFMLVLLVVAVADMSEPTLISMLLSERE